MMFSLEPSTDVSLLNSARMYTPSEPPPFPVEIVLPLSVQSYSLTRQISSSVPQGSSMPSPSQAQREAESKAVANLARSGCVAEVLEDPLMPISPSERQCGQFESVGPVASNVPSGL